MALKTTVPFLLLLLPAGGRAAGGVGGGSALHGEADGSPTGDRGRIDWKEVKRTRDGIAVYKREVPGSDLLAFKGEGEVAAPIDKVATIIFDTTRATEWIADLKESKILHWQGDLSFVEYDWVGTPFILRDRDFVSTVTIEKDPPAGRILFHYVNALDPLAPQRPPRVRGDLMGTTYDLSAAGPATRVIADIHIDPKGSIPRFIVNWVQADWPVDTFRGLRRQAAKPDVTVDPRFQLDPVSP